MLNHREIFSRPIVSNGMSKQDFSFLRFDSILVPRTLPGQFRVIATTGTWRHLRNRWALSRPHRPQSAAHESQQPNDETNRSGELPCFGSHKVHFWFPHFHSRPGCTAAPQISEHSSRYLENSMPCRRARSGLRLHQSGCFSRGLPLVLPSSTG